MKTIPVSLRENSYNIHLERGILSKAGALCNLNRRVLIVTDDGVPAQYAAAIAAQCAAPLTVTLPAGEASKSLSNLERLCGAMLDAEFDRKDCVVAVGGGVVGDLAGFSAAVYMRGIDFYNIPTTLLSQVDSSIGGKTAVDFHGVKNILGAFHQPKAVLIDPDTLSTLPPRHFANGMAEAIKMALTLDGTFFETLETYAPADFPANIETIIEHALLTKKKVVEADEKENGLRRVLNFGHTIGHGLESAAGLEELLHGECVALGMLPMCAPAVRKRLCKVLQNASLPTAAACDPAAVCRAMIHDKKRTGTTIHTVRCDAVGTFEMEETTTEQLQQKITEVYV